MISTILQFGLLLLSVVVSVTAFLDLAPPSSRSSICFVQQQQRQQQQQQQQPRKENLVRVRSSVEEDISPDGSGTAAADEITTTTNNYFIEPPTDIFPNAEFFTFQLAEHRPLGCTIEESLDPTDNNYVFVSKVVPNGFAEQAGIQVGDVVVAVTGLFGKMTPVLESGVDKIKGLVGSVADEDPLYLQVARGTGVMERHESAVVDLCQTVGISDKEVENCVVDFLKAGYYDSAMLDDNDDDDDDMECNNVDDEAECMIDGMMDMWADEMYIPSTTSGISDQTGTAADGTPKKKPKPWSSRSSPSGTYVRDPVTGEMRNIDA